MKAAAQVIPDSSLSHSRERERHLAASGGVVLFDGATKKHIEAHGVRKLGARAEAAVTFVESSGELAARSFEQIRCGYVRGRAAALEVVHPHEAVGKLARLRLD